MNNKKFKKAKAGLLLIASPRFRNLGEGLERGTYSDRQSVKTKEILDGLEGSMEIIYPDIVYEKDEMRQAINMFFTEEVDFVITEFLSWSEDFAWIRFLRDMPEVPIIFVNPVKERMTFKSSLEENDFIDFLCSGTLVGSLEAAGSIPRLNRGKVHIIMGNREEVTEEIISFSRAAKARAILHQSTVGLLASYNELMWSTYVDPYNLFARIGPEIHFISYSTLADQVAQVPDAEIKKYQNELTSRYHVMEDVEPDKFTPSVQASLGMAKLTEQLGIDILVFNDVDPAMFKLIGLRPGFYHPSLNNNISVMVPEADVGAGIITYIMKLISDKNVNFIEPFHIEAEDNTFAGGHAGPNDHNDPAFTDCVKIARDVRFAKTNYKYAGAPFAWYRIPPGRKTMTQLTEDNGSYKLVCTLVDSLEGEHILASYSHGIFRPVVPVKELFERVLKIGTTQHFAIVDGDYRKELFLLAKIMGFEYHEIV
jgi:L-arabinose isomerase